MLRDMDNLQARIETLSSENDKLNKSKKKLQSEVEDLNVELENYRTNFLNLEKKQRKFDQNLAEEKAISERSVLLFIKCMCSAAIFLSGTYLHLIVLVVVFFI